jgi:nucleotide-binding universal stress UspA family protein
MEHEGEARENAERGTLEVRRLLSRVPSSLEPEARLTRGPVAETLLQVARELPADLLVMGTHGPTTAEHRSLTERIVSEGPCPVLTLGEGYEPNRVLGALEGKPPEELSVVVPSDFSPASQAALDFAVALAELMPHRLVLVHALRPGKASNSEVAARRKELSALVPEHLTNRTTCEVRVGHAAPAIREAAREHEALFVLMAGHGKGALKRLVFGSTTLDLLRSCDCPVLFLPPHTTPERKGSPR